MRGSLALALLVLLAASAASAFESTCSVGNSPCGPGPESAQNEWISFLDEHRQVWEATRPFALPAAAADPLNLRVYTDGSTAEGGLPTMKPADFREAKRAVDRPGPHTIAEFTELPDFSYSLWDWVLGNETCPLDDSIGAIQCHTFATHLGPANSSHFPPQSREFYRAYHDLAIQRAKDCDAFAKKLGSARTRFLPYLVACEQEALVLEAVGQHFLQDAWSMGHMWERWGSPDPSDILPNLNGARMVGGLAGLIHGARGVMQGLIPGADVTDPMCAPSTDVAWRQPMFGSPLNAAVGDDYWSLVQGDYSTQFNSLRACAVAGMQGVLSQISNPALGGSSTPPAFDPLDICFTQRATNVSVALGSNLTFQEGDIPVNIDFVSVGGPILPFVVQKGDQPIADPKLALDVVRNLNRMKMFAKLDPDGVQLASGGLAPLFGFDANGAYANRTPIASYVDPPLPWPKRGENEPRSQGLARLFHKAHAPDWCDLMSLDYLAALKYRVGDLAGGAAEELATAKEICTEFSKRHARGRDKDGVATSDKPLCSFAATSPASVAEINVLTTTAGATDESVATAWCGCGDGTLGANEECDESASGGDVACPGACRKPNHSRTIGALKVYDDCRCGEICDDQIDNDGDGDIDCADRDCDQDPACAPTRIYFSVCPNDFSAFGSKIFSMNADGSDLKQVGVGGASVRVSPDGARLASVTSATTVSTSRIDGTARHDIAVQGTIEETQGEVAWSPEGTSLVIAVFGPSRVPNVPERQLQTAPDKTGTTGEIWHMGPSMSTSIDWWRNRWLFGYAYYKNFAYLNGVATSPALSEERTDVWNPADFVEFISGGLPRYRPDGTPSWAGSIGASHGLIVDGVLWLGTDAFGIPAYSPDGEWVAAAYLGGIAVFKFDGSSAYNAYFGTKICGLDWGPAVPTP